MTVALEPRALISIVQVHTPGKDFACSQDFSHYGTTHAGQVVRRTTTGGKTTALTSALWTELAADLPPAERTGFLAHAAFAAKACFNSNVIGVS
jgi:hypothetical protein